MFIRCARLCCLCLRQCGTNIEAAHIIDETRGGLDDADNGIPVCLDCHQEIGAYNDGHPKGNKFRPQELKARRNRVYHLVESGIIYAQVIAVRARASDRRESMPQFSEEPKLLTPSAEAKRFLKALISSEDTTSGVARKVSLLNEQDRAYVLDELVRKTVDGGKLIPIIAEIVEDPTFPRPDAILVTEQIVRAMTLYGEVSSKAEFLRTFPADVLGYVYEGLRLAFFEDIISIVKRDQFHEVNQIVPAFVEHVGAIPKQLHKDYVFALLSQANSGAYNGAPAAKRALESLPDGVAKAGILGLDKKFLSWRAREEDLKKFVDRFGHLGRPNQQKLFKDFVNMSQAEFLKKYLTDD